MSQPVTVRLPELAAEELRLIARREHRSISEIGARFIDEGLRQHRFPYIEFRSFNGERHACIKGALQVWQLIMVAKDYRGDVNKIAEHLDLKPEQVKAGLHYYENHSEEIDQALEENDLGYECLKQMLPNLQLSSVSVATETKADA
ncbi:MAG: transcriptional regulator [Armatimonadetes bacterium]|nr:transcriptional regulator [Armatimonadota bacterium]